jgi:peptidase A4-like protein
VKGPLAVVAALLIVAAASPAVVRASGGAKIAAVTGHTVTAPSLGVTMFRAPFAGIDREAVRAARRPALVTLRVHEGVDHRSSFPAGVVDHAAAPYSEVRAAFNNPLLTPSHDAIRRSSLWVGLGRSLAAGTDEDEIKGAQRDDAWIEFGALDVVLGGLPANPAQTMYVWISAAGPRPAFFIENMSTGDFVSLLGPPSPTRDVQPLGSAEWAEGVPRAPSAAPLALYNFVVFNGAEARGRSGALRPAGPPDEAPDDGGRSRVVASPDGLSLTIQRVGSR